MAEVRWGRSAAGWPNMPVACRDRGIARCNKESVRGNREVMRRTRKFARPDTKDARLNRESDRVNTTVDLRDKEVTRRHRESACPHRETVLRNRQPGLWIKESRCRRKSFGWRLMVASHPRAQNAGTDSRVHSRTTVGKALAAALACLLPCEAAIVPEVERMSSKGYNRVIGCGCPLGL